VKRTKSRRLLVLGGILALTSVAGCFGGGKGYSRGYSNSRYGYNGTFYNSKPYNGGYGNPYPYNSGYNDTHSYPQSFGNSNSYSSGLQHGVRPAEVARDDHQDPVTTQHVAVIPDRAHAINERQHSSIDRDHHIRKE
jgi:hypothetical protein